MKLTINVTAEDIAQGCACLPDSCPIARALRRTTGIPAWVYSGFVDFASTSRIAEVPMPPEGTVFIMNFDRNRDSAKPIELTFEVPEGLYEHTPTT